MKARRFSTATWQMAWAALVMLCAVHRELGATKDSPPNLAVQFYDPSDHPLPDVTVGRLLDTSDWKTPIGQAPANRWRVALSSFETVTSDRTGTALLKAESLFGRTEGKIALYALSKDHRFAGIFPVTRNNLKEPLKVNLAPACRVQATMASRELSNLGRTLERSFLRISSGRDEVIYMMSVRGQFEFWLPPGAYEYQASGRGSAGASVQAERGRLVVPENRAALTLGPIDLPTGKLAGLLDRPAPEFTGITAWRNGAPTTLADLRGKVVVLDFWNYACSICCAEMPELFEMQKKYADRGLVVIGMHGLLPATAEECDRRITRLKAGPWKNENPPFRIALDLEAGSPTSKAYGITAVPAIVLIDRTGKLLAEFASPHDPEFRKAVYKLLGVEAEPEARGKARAR